MTSAAFPDFQSEVTRWSCLSSDPNDFAFQAFAGSFADAGIGEDNFSGSFRQPLTVTTQSFVTFSGGGFFRRIRIGVRGKPGVLPLVRGGSDITFPLPDVNAQSTVTETSPGPFDITGPQINPTIVPRWFMKAVQP